MPISSRNRAAPNYRSWGAIGREKDALGGLSGSCNNDVECSEGVGWEDPVRSVVRILSGGFGVCTGAMINNVKNSDNEVSTCVGGSC